MAAHPSIDEASLARLTSFIHSSEASFADGTSLVHSINTMDLAASEVHVGLTQAHKSYVNTLKAHFAILTEEAARLEKHLSSYRHFLGQLRTKSDWVKKEYIVRLVLLRWFEEKEMRKITDGQLGNPSSAV